MTNKSQRPREKWRKWSKLGSISAVSRVWSLILFHPSGGWARDYFLEQRLVIEPRSKPKFPFHGLFFPPKPNGNACYARLDILRLPFTTPGPGYGFVLLAGTTARHPAVVPFVNGCWVRAIEIHVFEQITVCVPYVKQVFHCVRLLLCLWTKETSWTWPDTTRFLTTVFLCSEFKLKNIYSGVNFCGKNVCGYFYWRELIFADRWKNRKN